MTRLEAIQAIKNNTKLLGLLFSGSEKEEDEVAEVKLEAVKLAESDLMVDVQGELIPGTAVVTSSSMGSQDAPDDTYKLSNGIEFSTKGGKIDKVISDGKNEEVAPKDVAPVAAPDANDAPAPKDAPVAEAKPVEAPKDAPVPAPVQDAPASTAALQTLVDKISEMDAMITAIKTALEGKASAQSMSAIADSFKNIEQAFEVLSGTPAEFTKVDKSLEAKADKENKLNALASVWTKK